MCLSLGLNFGVFKGIKEAHNVLLDAGMVVSLLMPALLRELT